MDEIAKVKKILKDLGIRLDLKGYHYILKGVMLIKNDFDDSKTARSFMVLYAEIADIFNTETHCVERCIRHAIDVAKANKTNTFDQLFGDAKKITVSTFICVIADHIAQID